jgi:2-iminobutanoate/2-iminopropanoate deaminase
MRRSIHIDEFKHRNPIPNAARIGNIIVSGLIRGVDPVTHAYPASMEQQCRFMFDNVRRTVEAGGGTIANIIKVTVWMGQMQREPVNVEWLKMFPDPDTRPARQIMLTPMEPGVLVQCDYMAVLGES